MKASPILIGAVILTADCGYMNPAKDPDSLTVQVPLEQTPPATGRNDRTGQQDLEKANALRMIDTTRRDICAHLETDSPDNPCSGEIFRDVSANGLENEDLKAIRNRCLVLMDECQKEKQP